MRGLAGALLLSVSVISIWPSLGQATIRVGYGIGGVTVGERETEVLIRLGTPRRVHHYVSFGQHVHALFFTKPAIAVGIDDELGAAHKRVVSVWTYSRSERTPEGAGVGDAEARLRKLYHSIRCLARPRAYCLLMNITHKTGTGFYLRHGRVYLIDVIGV
jgi:hypothetical protein